VVPDPLALVSLGTGIPAPDNNFMIQLFDNVATAISSDSNVNMFADDIALYLHYIM